MQSDSDGGEQTSGFSPSTDWLDALRKRGAFLLERIGGAIQPLVACGFTPVLLARLSPEYQAQHIAAWIAA